MNDALGFNDSVVGKVHNRERLELKGTWMVDHYRQDSLIAQIKIDNLIVNTGKNSILDTMFNAATQTAAASWFAGLINASGFTTIVAADTIASHAGWAELTAGYSQATRPLWGQGAASGQAITNAAPIVFSMTATNTVQGLFIATVSTKGSSSGLLWAAASFPTALPVVNGDELRCTYNVAT